MDPQRIERNSHLYEEILSELQQQSNLRNNLPHIVSNRKDYARLDISSMGVDIKENFNGTQDKCNNDKDECNNDNGIDDNKEIKHIPGNLKAEDLYALPNKIQQKTKCQIMTDDDEENKKENGKKEEIDHIEDKDSNSDLPPGWEKHEDNDGPYYWHIKSGTIQREPPAWPKELPKELKTPVLSTNPQQFLSSLSDTNKNQNNLNSFYDFKDETGGTKLQVNKILNFIN